MSRSVLPRWMHRAYARFAGYFGLLPYPPAVTPPPPAPEPEAEDNPLKDVDSFELGVRWMEEKITRDQYFTEIRRRSAERHQQP